MDRYEGEIILNEYVLGFHQDRRFYIDGWSREKELRMLGLLKELREEGLTVTRNGCLNAIVERLRDQLNPTLDMNEDLTYWRRKIHRLRLRFKRFRECLMYSGVNWNPETNACQAIDPVWEEFIRMKQPWLLSYYSEGEKHYELMEEVFLPWN